MRYGYKDLLHKSACCNNCDNRADLEYNNIDLLYCPIQEQIVEPSGYCRAYEGFWKQNQPE